MVDILMATYNGEKYLREQIESIIAQTYTDWRLVIRDDCSDDNTVFVVEEYRQRLAQKIFLIKAQKPSGGAMHNFFALLDCAVSDYIMFCDQDDVWLKDKIAVTVEKMHELEREYGKQMPLLVHTDLKVVDKDLNIINESLFYMQKMYPDRDKKLENLLRGNIVTGCTVMFNRALLNYLDKKPKVAVMHDMWIALVAAAFGKIGFVDEGTILYRQHGDNSNGAKDVRSIAFYLNRMRDLQREQFVLAVQFRQAYEFRDIFAERLSPRNKEILEGYLSYAEKNPLKQLFSSCKAETDFKKLLKNIWIMMMWRGIRSELDKMSNS